MNEKGKDECVGGGHSETIIFSLACLVLNGSDPGPWGGGGSVSPVSAVTLPAGSNYMYTMQAPTATCCFHTSESRLE